MVANFVQLVTASYSLHINCGGKMVAINGSIYDDDSDAGGPARFQHSGTKYWGFSSTGDFMDNDSTDYYTVSNQSKLSTTNAELYMNARLSPISLTYYGFCLGNGNYTVNLHFAEIIFTDDQTYNSLGRRLFDIYIQKTAYRKLQGFKYGSETAIDADMSRLWSHQNCIMNGKLVNKDFNIAKEAGGVGKEVTKSFHAIVTNTTLEIRLYWAGKGTTSLPYRSVYGPLISAISVKSDFIPPSKNGCFITAGVMARIVIVVIVVLVIGILLWKRCPRLKNSVRKEVRDLDLHTSIFTLRQIKAATNNFDFANKIGEGGFGPVFKLLHFENPSLTSIYSKILLDYHTLANNSREIQWFKSIH
ncbi:hypothetical protein Lal_00032849 [Lupinus albus]|nr:hypothetical protein Lal_00032849 [Lupinus albus]